MENNKSNFENELMTFMSISGEEFMIDTSSLDLDKMVEHLDDLLYNNRSILIHYRDLMTRDNFTEDDVSIMESSLSYMKGCGICPSYDYTINERDKLICVMTDVMSLINTIIRTIYVHMFSQSFENILTMDNSIIPEFTETELSDLNNYLNGLIQEDRESFSCSCGCNQPVKNYGFDNGEIFSDEELKDI